MYNFKDFRVRLENYLIRNFYNFLTWSFNSYLPRLLSYRWSKSTISQINKQNYILPCSFCSYEYNSSIKKIIINNLFGIFDKSKLSLMLYYGTWIPNYIWIKYPLIRKTYLEKTFQSIKNKIYIKYVKCDNCGLVYQNYPHENKLLNLFYKVYYRRDGGSTFGRVENNKSPHYLAQESLATFFIDYLSIKKHSKILDVGCAEGTLPLVLKKFEMISYGIDPADSMIKYGKEKLNLKNLKSGTYQENSYEKNLFDVINCYHVFEHLLNLKDILNSFYAHLKPEGFLIISVPCIDHAKTDENYNIIMANDHIYVFSNNWFENNLPQYGFEVVDKYFSPFDFKVLGQNNSGLKFNIGLNGERPGEMRVIAKKTFKD